MVFTCKMIVAGHRPFRAAWQIRIEKSNLRFCIIFNWSTLINKFESKCIIIVFSESNVNDDKLLKNKLYYLFYTFMTWCSTLNVIYGKVLIHFCILYCCIPISQKKIINVKWRHERSQMGITETHKHLPN